MDAEPTPGPGNIDLALFRDIVEQSPDAIIFADVGGRIRVWNRRAEGVFGFSAGEALGNSLDMIIPERFRRAHWEGFRKAIETGQTRHADRVLTTRSVHKSGSRLYVDISFGLVRDGSGSIAGSVAVARDCTERHLREKS